MFPKNDDRLNYATIGFKAKEFLHCDSVYLLGDPSDPLPVRHSLVVGMWQASCRQQMQAAAEEGMATTVALQRWGPW